MSWRRRRPWRRRWRLTDDNSNNNDNANNHSNDNSNSNNNSIIIISSSSTTTTNNTNTTTATTNNDNNNDNNDNSSNNDKIRNKEVGGPDVPQGGGLALPRLRGDRQSRNGGLVNLQFMFYIMNSPSILISKLQTTVPSRKAYLYATEIEESYKP